MTTYDIIEMTYNKYKNAKITVEEIRDLLLQLDGGSSFFKLSLESELEMFAELHGVCPKCGGKIATINETDASRGEYFGRPVTEKEFDLECKDCGYTVE